MSTQPESAESTPNLDDEIMFFRRKHRHVVDLVAGLNLTAMMDVLTILLVYLIKVYADAPENITLNDDLRPPTSTAPDNLQPSVRVLISKTAIMVDNDKVVDISGGRIVAVDAANPYAPLSQALARRVEVIKAIADKGGSPFDGNLMVIADEGTPYELVSSVLYQAGKAQFTKYRLIVRRGGPGTG
jgi:biopolymer transport protein ExbD